MKILYDSSLLKTLADMLNNKDAKYALQTAYDLLNDGATYTEKVGPVIDQIFANLNYLNKSTNAWVLAKEALVEAAGKAAVSAVTKVIVSLLEEINSSFPWTSLFQDILALLTNADEDFAAIKAVRLRTDNLNTEKPEYQNTFSLYNKAVHEWRNAPRMTDSTIFTAYSAIPVSISAYIRESVKELLSLLVSPDDPTMGPIFAQIEKFYAVLDQAVTDMRNNQIRKNPITIRSATLQRTPALTYLSSNPEYRYYIQLDMLKGLRIPEAFISEEYAESRRYGVRFRLYKDTEEDPSGWLLLNSETDEWPNVLERSYNAAASKADVTVTSTKIIGIDTGFNAKKNIFLEDLVAQYSTGKTDFLNYLKQDDTFLYLELVRLDEDTVTELEGFYSITILDVVPVELFKTKEDAPASDEAWYSIFSIGGIFPDAADWVANIEKLIEDWLLQLTGLASDARVVLGEFRNMLLGIINKVFAFYKGLFKLIMTLARVLKFMDIRYMVFEGSYTDLVRAWMILRNRFGIIEEGDYLIFNLVASVKAKSVSQLSTEALKRSVEDTKKNAESALLGNVSIQNAMSILEANRRNGQPVVQPLDPEVTGSVAENILRPLTIGQLSTTATTINRDFGFTYIPEIKTWTESL